MMRLDQGLVFDRRCNVTPKIPYQIDDEPAPPTSPTGEWSGILVVNIPPGFQDHELGTLLKMDELLLQFWQPQTMACWSNFGFVEVPTAGTPFTATVERRVIAFTLLSGAGRINLFVDGQAVVVNPMVVYQIPGLEEMTRITTPIVLGDEGFEGTISRFSLYNRILSPREMELLAREYLHPRLVQLWGKTGALVDSVSFVFSDSSVQYYGGKGGYLIDEPCYEPEDGEYLEYVEGCRHDTYFLHALSVGSTSARLYEMSGWMEDLPEEETREEWYFQRTAPGNEIYGLQVERVQGFMGIHEVVGVLEREIITDPEQIMCRQQVEAGYINQLHDLQRQANELAANIPNPPPAPTLSDWHMDAKREWLKYLRHVNYLLALATPGDQRR